MFVHYLIIGILTLALPSKNGKISAPNKLGFVIQIQSNSKPVTIKPVQGLFSNNVNPHTIWASLLGLQFLLINECSVFWKEKKKEVK